MRCPVGYKEYDNLCVSKHFLSPRRQCPEGFTQGDDFTCYTESEMPKVHKCPDGFEEKGNSCVKEETRKPETFCPGGAEKAEGGKCAAKTEHVGHAVCEGPAFLRSGSCVLETVEEAKKSCDPGFEHSAGFCTREVYAHPAPECPEDFMYDDALQQCRINGANRDRGRTSMPHMACPSDYQIVALDEYSGKTQCKGVVTRQPTLFCDDGKVLRQGRCVEHKTSKPRYEFGNECDKKKAPDDILDNGMPVCYTTKMEEAGKRCAEPFKPELKDGELQCRRVRTSQLPHSRKGAALHISTARIVQ
eukprot:GHVU01084073.1.p1 GENE.GHVU01084073.1~~GHVU01084073.1.p1  ORF type:complete len:303 (-),score=25.67 GHVU01084073.1:595-1503(-)